jgi:hypothetical protein
MPRRCNSATREIRLLARRYSGCRRDGAAFQRLAKIVCIADRAGVVQEQRGEAEFARFGEQASLPG